MHSWQYILLAFVFLLPMVLMIDYWGDDRLTFRGKPIRRPWVRQVDHPPIDEHEAH
ncbi:MAG TPA: hypothetical protein VGA69_05085 [Nitriliruptorales bacterium]